MPRGVGIILPNGQMAWIRNHVRFFKGDVLYLFHHSVHLPELTMWPAFVRRCQDVCYVIDLPIPASAKEL